MLFILSYLIVFVFQPINGRLMTMNYIIAIIILGITALLLKGYFGVPKVVVITTNSIQYGDASINWDSIKSVKFTCSSGKDYRDTWIVLETEQYSHIIHTKYYKEPKRLRGLVEKWCNEKDIKYIVEDRGL